MFDNMTDQELNDLSRALAQYCYRSGEVENVHANGNLTDADMKIINKDVHNRIAGLLLALKKGYYEEVESLLSNYARYNRYDWDICTPYLDEINTYL